ncbi:MAG: cobyrinic acid a,c-diamide synthase, partial [Rhodospirillaceae bacterium]
AMAGLLGLDCSFARRRLHLGYRSVRLAVDGPLGAAGTGFRGHEFHFASVVDAGASTPLFHCGDADGATLPPAGELRGSVAGSFIHLIDRA